MGQEAEQAARRAAFAGYTVDDALMEAAGEQAWFLHCLPAHRGEEVAASVIDGPRERGLAAGRQPHARRSGRAHPSGRAATESIYLMEMQWRRGRMAGTPQRNRPT